MNCSWVQGAFWGLTLGLVIGLVRFIWECSYGQTMCGEENSIPSIISKVHYLHFGIILFVIVCAICVVVSLSTEAIEDKYVSENLSRILSYVAF